MTDALREGEYRLDVGGIVMAVRCRQPDLAVGLSNWFGRPSAVGRPHIDLTLELMTHADAPILPSSLLTTKKVQADGRFDIADGLITGRYDPATQRGEILAKAILLEGRLPRILEQIFYQAFQSALAAADREAWLVHSSAVIHQGRGFLFVGPSEAGKSTVARLSRSHHVLGDEMNAVIPTAEGMDVAGTVFNGTFREKQPGRARLEGVFLLQQARRHALSEVPEAEAAAVLAAEIVPPVGLDEVPGPGTLGAMVDAAVRIAAKTTLKRMEFLPDAGFWELIEETFDLPGEAGDASRKDPH